MQNDIIKNVFIILSKKSEWEHKMANAIKDVLWALGLSVYEYEDWPWEVNQGGRIYRNSGGQVDLIRLSLGHPKPFYRKIGTKIDDEWLEGAFKSSDVILSLNPGTTSGTKYEHKFGNKPNIPLVEARTSDNVPQPPSWAPLAFDFIKNDRRDGLIYDIAARVKFATALSQLCKLPGRAGNSIAFYLGWKSRLISLIIYRYSLLSNKYEYKHDQLSSINDLLSSTGMSGKNVLMWYKKNACSLEIAEQAIMDDNICEAIRLLRISVNEYCIAWENKYFKDSILKNEDWLVQSSYEARARKWKDSAMSASNVLTNKNDDLYFAALLRFAIAKHYYFLNKKLIKEASEIEKIYNSVVEGSKNIIERSFAELFRSILFIELGEISKGRDSLIELSKNDRYPEHIKAEAFMELAKLDFTDSKPKSALENYNYAISCILNNQEFEEPYWTIDYCAHYVVSKSFSDLMRSFKIGKFDQELRAFIEKAVLLEVMGDYESLKQILKHINPILISDNRLFKAYLKLCSCVEKNESFYKKFEPEIILDIKK